MSAKVGMRALARELGVSHTAVAKAIESGRLKGSVERRGRNVLIDVELAKSEWATNTDPRMQREHGRKKRYDGPGELFDPAGARAAKAAAQEKSDPAGPTLTQSRSLREAYLARIARLQYEEMNGSMVPTDAVRRERYETGKLVRESIQNIPAQLAPDCLRVALETKDVRAIQLLLEVRLNEALEALAHGRLDGNAAS